MPQISARRQNGELILSLPEDAATLEEILQLLQAFIALPVERRRATLRDLTGNQVFPGISGEEDRYLRLVIDGLRQRDANAVEYAHADLFALTEAQRLKVPLAARHRNTLIQYYIDRASPSSRHRGGGNGPSRGAVAALVRAARKKD